MKGITKVTGLQDALENLGIRVYAPRAGRFLEVDEARKVWGLLPQNPKTPKPLYAYCL